MKQFKFLSFGSTEVILAGSEAMEALLNDPLRPIRCSECTKIKEILMS